MPDGTDILHVFGCLLLDPAFWGRMYLPLRHQNVIHQSKNSLKLRKETPLLTAVVTVVLAVTVTVTVVVLQIVCTQMVVHSGKPKCSLLLLPCVALAPGDPFLAMADQFPSIFFP